LRLDDYECAYFEAKRISLGEAQYLEGIFVYKVYLLEICINHKT